MGRTAEALGIPAAAEDQIQPTVTIEVRYLRVGSGLHLQDGVLLATVVTPGGAPEDIDVLRIHVAEDEVEISILVEVGDSARLPDADAQLQLAAARFVVTLLAAP